MKKTREPLWDVSAEAHYARHLTLCSASAANDPHVHRGASPLWLTGDKTLLLVLSTAFSLQPRRWSLSVEELGVPGTGDRQ